MRKTTIVASILSLVAASAVGAYALGYQDPHAPKMPTKEEIEKGWARYMELMKPSETHKFLDQFVGKWNMTTRMWMGASTGDPTPPMEDTKGSCEANWLYDGRWIQSKTKFNMMGMAVESTVLMGYDNYKKKFVFSKVDNVTTNMLFAEGVLDRTGKNLVFYGPLDEPITNEHDKPVKYAYRMLNKDKYVLEIHDLAIGETNAKVLEFEFNRVKEAK
ncbi:MAG: DUF1579 family protein [Planctomycetota bacterium]